MTDLWINDVKQITQNAVTDEEKISEQTNETNIRKVHNILNRVNNFVERVETELDNDNSQILKDIRNRSKLGYKCVSYYPYSYLYSFFQLYHSKVENKMIVDKLSAKYKGLSFALHRDVLYINW